MTQFKSALLLFTFVVLSAGGIYPCFSRNNDPGKEKDYDRLFKSFSKKVEKERIRKNVFYLSRDPLPRRVLNWSRPGQTISTLEEADAWIIQQLTRFDYAPKTDETRVQAFGRDFTKPISQQYALPKKDDPWYTAHNIIAEKKGTEDRQNVILILAHKDSQSWIASPGANDNAIGTCGALELALALSKYQPKHTIRFIFCNEEHFPWTSVTAAKEIKSSGLDVLAAINLDGIGVKAPENAGKMINITRYTTPEGEKIADLMTNLNQRFSLGLDQTKHSHPQPGDDDGSFIKAGFPWTVLNVGSYPYADPNYHTEKDVPEKVDIKNAERTVQLTLAAILYLDNFGRPKEMKE